MQRLRPLPPGHPRPYRPAMADLGMIVARNVRAERARRGWRQEDLAGRLGWTRGNVGHLESGRRKATVVDLPLLCGAFEIPLAKLLDGADAADLERLGL
jgi:transcriptional regulator with XRE-family HTH domain